MTLHIDDRETEKLAAEIAEITGESEAEAGREALRERRQRLAAEPAGKGWARRNMREWLETEIWPQIPDELLDRPPMSKAEVEENLGFGPEGYCPSTAPQ